MSLVRLSLLLSGMLAVMLLAVSCGDDDESASTGPGDTAPGSTSTETTSTGSAGTGSTGGEASPELSECVDHENPGMSLQVELFVVMDRSPQVLPSGIGITSDCIRPLHTHTNFVVSVEYPEVRTFTLGDFFAVWGPEGPYWEKDVDNMSVDGVAFCSPAEHIPDCAGEDPLGVVLEDGMRIAIDFNSQ